MEETYYELELGPAFASGVNSSACCAETSTGSICWMSRCKTDTNTRQQPCFPAYIDSWYGRTSFPLYRPTWQAPMLVSSGATPLSTHSTVQVWPPLQDMPGSGCVICQGIVSGHTSLELIGGDEDARRW